MSKNVPVKHINNERKIERWVTINHNHVPIYEGETEEDVKARLDNWGKQGSTKPNYHQYVADKKVMTEQFTMNNPLIVDGKVVDAVDSDVLADVYETIEDIKSKYRAHVTRIELLDSSKTESTEDDSWMACIDYTGKLQLNKEYFESEWYLDDVAKDCEKEGHHPPAPNGAIGTIAHELGHAIVYQRIYDMKNKLEKGDDWGLDADCVSINRWLSGRTNNPVLETTKGKQIFNNWYGDMMDIQERVHTNKQIQEQWGGKDKPSRPNMSLSRIAEQFPRPYGVSKYAGKNNHELIAESFADVYCNGSEASLISKEVYKVICKEMEK